MNVVMGEHWSCPPVLVFRGCQPIHVLADIWLLHTLHVLNFLSTLLNILFLFFFKIENRSNFIAIDMDIQEFYYYMSLTGGAPIYIKYMVRAIDAVRCYMDTLDFTSVGCGLGCCVMFLEVSYLCFNPGLVHAIEDIVPLWLRIKCPSTITIVDTS